MRIPGTGIRDTRVVGGQRQVPASAQPNISVQLGKLVLLLLLVGFILSLITASFAVGYGVVGGIFVAGLVGTAVWLIVLIQRRRIKKLK